MNYLFRQNDLLAIFLLMERGRHIVNSPKYFMAFNSTITKYLILIIGLIFLICNVFGNTSILFKNSFNYNAIVFGKEVWRMVTHIFFHGSLVHILSNTFGLVEIVDEEENDMATYLKKTFFFAVLNPLYELVIIALFRLTIDPYFQYFTVSIGYSGILYAFMTYKFIYLYGFKYDTMRALAMNLILPSLLMNNVSLLGHFVGILSGATYLLLEKYRIIL